MKKIRVALFSEVLKENLDGVTNTLYNIIDRIPKERFEYLFITASPPSKHVKLPYPVITVPKIAFPTNKDYPIALPFFNSRLKKALDDFRPDIIHFTTPFTLGSYALNYAKRNNIPALTTYHTHFASYAEYYLKNMPGLTKSVLKVGWKYLNWIYNQCDRIYVPTSSIMDELLEQGIEEKRMTIWGRGVNTEIFNPAARDEKYIEQIAGKATKRVLFVSRLVWEKELKTLIGVYQHFKKTRPDIKMIVTGSGPREAELKKLMPDAVFTGKLIKKDLARMYASCDVFIFPSITETFGNVVLEAMACGCIPVVAAQGGPKGIVRHGITGLHAEPRNIDDFCRKISLIADNPDFAEKMSVNAANYALTQKWEILVKNMFNSYEHILASNNTPGAMTDANEIAA